ncbi:MAG TPA: hypothetical protein PKY30_05685, partial [Myxococcota bacterium]|nr:hypothetical protein [Myxococcota bacterium]
GSGEFEYLYTVVQSSNASADVRLRLDWLLGRDDFSVYQGLYGPAMAMGSMIQTQADVAAGNPKAPARFNSPFDLGSDEDDGICYLPGMAPKKLSDIFSLKTPAVNPQDKIAPGEVADRAAGKAPGIREFDSSEMPEEEEEEEAPKTSNGKPSDRGMGKVQTTTTREGKMVVGDGKVGGEASAKRVVKQRSGAGSSVGGGASLEAGEHLSGSANIAGKRTSKDGGTIGGSAQVGRDEEGNWNGKLRLEGESLDRKGSGVGGGKSIGYDEKKGVSIGQDLTVKEKGANGATTSTTGGLTVTTNGNLAATGGRTVEDAKGNKKGTTGSASYDHESGAFSGGVKYSNTNKNGDDLGSVGGTGSIDMDGKDGKTGAKGAITASKGSKTVSLSGGYSVKVEKPVQEGNRWVITWETDLSGELSGGVKGKKAGASATVGAGKKKTGRRSFATEAEAKAFFEHPKLDGMPSDATAVASMSEGDSRSTENSVNVGGDVNGKLGMVEVGVGGSHSSSDYQNLTKGEGGKVQVEVGTKELNEVHGNVGISGVSWGAGHSAASNESVTVEFDLSTPEGKNAFQHHQKFHALPARGWRVVGTAKGNASTNSYNLGLLGVKIGTSHTVSHEEEMSEGNKYERDSGTDASSVSVPLLGSYSRSHRLSMLQVNDGRSFFNTESTVKGSDLDDVRSGLAKSALGTEQGSGGSNKGTYRLQASISEADMDHFIRVASSADAAKTFNYHGGLHATDGLEDLQDGLRKAAGDKDAQRRVLARWVADEGVDALQTLHTLTHGKFDQGGAGGTSMFVAIDGDPYMNGMKGQLDLELRIQGWDRRLAGGERGPALVSEIRKDIVFQREKAKHLESCSELPHRVYEQEYDRIRSNTTILESVLQRAMESDGASAASASNLQSPKFAAFRRATLNLSVARTKCDHALEDAYPRYKIEHKGAYSDNGRGRAQDLPAEKNAYAAALKSYENGEAA